MSYLPTIVFIAISLILSVFLPIILLIVWRRKTKSRLLPALIGAVVFVVFVLVLESLLHRVVLGLPIMGTSTVLYVIYAGLAAGVFEETGRWLAFRFVLKKHRTRETAITYGIGHGGIEAILLAGISMATNLVAVIILATSGVQALGNIYGTSAASIVDAFNTTAPSFFLVGGIERVIAITLHIALSVIVFRAIIEKKWGYWLLAVLLHAAVDCYAVLYQKGIITNVWLIELGVFVMTIIVVIIAVRFYRTMRRKPVPPETEDIPSQEN